MAKFRVKELSQAKGWTQEMLSHESGVTISTVRRIWQNKGAEEPRASTLGALARALGVRIEDLYSQSDAPESEGGRLQSNKIGRQTAPLLQGV